MKPLSVVRLSTAKDSYIVTTYSFNGLYVQINENEETKKLYGYAHDIDKVKLVFTNVNVWHKLDDAPIILEPNGSLPTQEYFTGFYDMLVKEFGEVRKPTPQPTTIAIPNSFRQLTIWLNAIGYAWDMGEADWAYVDGKSVAIQLLAKTYQDTNDWDKACLAVIDLARSKGVDPRRHKYHKQR